MTIPLRQCRHAARHWFARLRERPVVLDRGDCLLMSVPPGSSCRDGQIWAVRGDRVCGGAAHDFENPMYSATKHSGGVREVAFGDLSTPRSPRAAICPQGVETRIREEAGGSLRDVLRPTLPSSRTTSPRHCRKRWPKRRVIRHIPRSPTTTPGEPPVPVLGSMNRLPRKAGPIGTHAVLSPCPSGDSSEPNDAAQADGERRTNGCPHVISARTDRRAHPCASEAADKVYVRESRS